MKSRGQSEILSTVILTATILAVAAMFLVVAMRSFNYDSAYYSISYVASFLTNVADDIDTYLMSPGVSLTYALPSTEYGVYNYVYSNDAYCRIYVNASGANIITATSGVLIYGVPPSYFSIPASKSAWYVWRGSNMIGYPTVNPSNFSLIVGPGVFAPTGTLVSIVQFGYGSVDGVSYGTFLAMVPRVLVINGSLNGGVGYIYIPVFVSMGNSTGRNILTIKILSVSSFSLSDVKYLIVAEKCNIGKYVLGPKSVSVVGNNVYIVEIRIGINMG
ncbi:MAG: hypothetical protein ACP5L5_09650 [Vulcanisaeta sp.]|uniref:hypothetical protein n=1 Tax=Vulcanisaeta sp. TaxID=2020871 RepID=UPI003D0DF2C2